MDKLEHYLDQVCRRIGGPRALRLHIRQELGEHLRDAAAEHRAAGLSQEEALTRALEDFGRPDEVRSELEATHGHRLMAVVIDKAIEWKEMTMKAKWLWTSWAYLALAVVIVLELLFLYFNGIMVVPKFQVLMRDGIVDPAIAEDAGAAWMPEFVVNLREAGRYSLLFIVVAAVAWGLFEWRVRSENKTFMRLSALGTVAVGLMVLVILMAGSLVICFCLGAPPMARLSQAYILDQIAHVDASVSVVMPRETKVPGRFEPTQWDKAQVSVQEASLALDKLATAPGAGFRALAGGSSQVGDELRKNVNTGREQLLGAQQAIRNKNVDQLTAAMHKFRQTFNPVAEAAKKGPK